MRRWIWRILLAALVLSALTVGVLAADPEPWENVPVKDKDFQYEPIDASGGTVTGTENADGTVNYSEGDFEKIAAYSVTKYIGDSENATIPDRFNNKPVVAIGIPKSDTAPSYSNADSIFMDSKLQGYVTIPNSVTTIYPYAFAEADVRGVDIPGTVKTIGQYAFSTCTTLVDVNILDSANEDGTIILNHTTIGDHAFYKCDHITSLVIPNSVRRIGKEAFSGCSGLEDLVLPESVTSIDYRVFSGCENLKNIVLLGNNVQMKDDSFPWGAIVTQENGAFVHYTFNMTRNTVIGQITKAVGTGDKNLLKTYTDRVHEITKPAKVDRASGWNSTEPCKEYGPGGTVTLSFTCKGFDQEVKETVKVKKEVPVLDEKGAPVMGADGKPQTEIKEVEEEVSRTVHKDCTAFKDSTGDRTANRYSATRNVSAVYHDEVPMPEKKPTCVEDGLTGGIHCRFCDTEFEAQTVVKATGTHTPPLDENGNPITEIGIVKEPTCTEDGEETISYECTVCKQRIKTGDGTPSLIPATGHHFYDKDGNPVKAEPDTIRAATCTEAGLEVTYHLCTVCNEKLTCENCEGFANAITAITPSAGKGKPLNAEEAAKLTTAIEAYTKHLDTQHKTLKIEDGKVYFPATYRELPKAGHTKPASVKSTVTKAPTCTEDGLEEWPLYQCTVCKEWVDKESAVIPKLGGEHDWTETETRKEPTCTEEGISVPKCSICGALDETKETDIPALGHEVDETAETTKIIEGEDKTWPATCTKKGQTTLTGVCIRSDELHGDGPRENVTVIKEIEMLPHTPETPVEEIPATCTAPGKKITHPTKCKVCGTVISGEEKEEIIPAKGHTWGDFTPNEGQDMTPNETCVSKTVAGKVKCTVCGAEEERTLTIEGLGKHTWGEWEPSEDGKTETRTCSVCKETETRDVTAPDEPEDDPCKDGHTWGEWILSADGKTETRICEICGETETRPADTTESEKPKSYQISVIPGAGGAASASRSTAQSGDTVTLTVTASSGYELDMIRAIRGGASVVSLTDLGGGQYRFTMPADNVEIRVTFSQRSSNSWSGSNWASAPGEGSGNTDPRRTQDTAPAQITAPAGTPRAGTWGQLYVDLPASHWAAGEINWANQMGYMSGSNGRFNPDGTITVQQVWMVMARLMGTYPANMAEARRWAVETGFATGSDPERAMTRHQVVTALYRCAVLQGRAARPSGLTLAGYTDSSLVPTVARDAMIWAVSSGVVTGDSSNRLNPTATITRAQFAVLLYRFSQRV